MIVGMHKVKHIPEILLRGRGFIVSVIMQACKRKTRATRRHVQQDVQLEHAKRSYAIHL